MTWCGRVPWSLLLEIRNCCRFLWASLIAQLVKNLPEMQETCFDSWVRKICWRRDMLPTPVFSGFPCGSDGKESTCNAGDLGSTPGLGRSPGEGKGYPLQYSGLENSMGSQRVRHDQVTFTFTFHENWSLVLRRLGDWCYRSSSHTFVGTLQTLIIKWKITNRKMEINSFSEVI